MKNTLIRNASVVNEGEIKEQDVLIIGGRIEKISDQIKADNYGALLEIDANGRYLLPGVIDAQVHFREPGLTHKANISSESSAAVAGGVTSYMEMPNTVPSTLTQELLEEKYQIASKTSLANYSFFMGLDQNNLEEVLKTDNEKVCGVSDDGLYFNSDKGIIANYPDFLEKLFAKCNSLIALHSEDDAVIEKNLNHYISKYGEDIPVKFHPHIRTEEACMVATQRVLDIAKKHNARFHLLHVSTAAEANLFNNNLPIREKRLTGEVSAHHLYFSEKDYDRLGNKIKWNPAIKSERDQAGLLDALLIDKMDIITTDHAPHAFAEKQGNYLQAKSGAPLVQYSLQMMLEFYQEGKISLEKIVEKMSHNVAEVYRMKDRGYIREGYHADLVLVDLNSSYEVSKSNILSKCNWSPLEGKQFKNSIAHTWVNGNLVFSNGNINHQAFGERLMFEKDR